MKYQVKLKNPKDFTEADYCKSNTLCEMRYGNIPYGILFDTLEEAKEACIKHEAYGIIDDDMCDYVWYNPDYKSKSFEELRRKLGRILLPH
jgi:hypothetical protein